MNTPTVSQNEIEEKWYLINAKGQRVGRLTTIVSELLLGKNNPKMKQYLLPKNKVIVINSDKVDIPFKRGFTKFYKWYSGYPSGQRVEDLNTKKSKDPNYVIEHAIKGMLPKNKRGREIFNNLKVYSGAEHPHEAQTPEVIDVTQVKF